LVAKLFISLSMPAVVVTAGFSVNQAAAQPTESVPEP
jgi:hypothetical protein